MLPDGERGFSTTPERTCGHGLRSPSPIRALTYDSFFNLQWCATQKHLYCCPGGRVALARQPDWRQNVNYALNGTVRPTSGFTFVVLVTVEEPALAAAAATAAGLLAVWSTNRFESVRGCESNLSLLVYGEEGDVSGPKPGGTG